MLKEVSDQQSKDMVNGIADILRDVKDMSNRTQIAKRMMNKFDREGVKYDEKRFMEMCDIPTE
jgi:hypothetical protein